MTTLTGTADDDTLHGTQFGDTIRLLDGDDFSQGGWGNDVLIGGGGNDSLDGWEDHDSLLGGGGNDTLTGGSANDTLDGGAGRDSLLGGSAHDLLRGGGGRDTLDGGWGNDTLIGGAGRDRLDGGFGGADRFVFDDGHAGPGAAGRDLITRFDRSEGDRIDLARIDADTGLAGDQHFAFIGGAAFTTAGQVRAVALDAAGHPAADPSAATALLIQMNTGGTPDAEMEILVQGWTGQPAASWFVL